MLIRRYITVVCLLLAAPPNAAANTLLVWGDSLSAAYGIPVEQGWVSLLQARLDDTQDASWRVVNGSISGETTDGGLARLPAALATNPPDIVILGLGSNDGLQGKPLGFIKQRLQRMIQLTRDVDAKVLLLGNRMPPNYGAAYADGFAQLYTDLAAEQSVPLVPFLLAGVATDFSLMQSDGLHPVARAQPRLLETVWRYLQTLL